MQNVVRPAIIQVKSKTKMVLKFTNILYITGVLIYYEHVGY